MLLERLNFRFKLLVLHNFYNECWVLQTLDSFQVFIQIQSIMLSCLLDWKVENLKSKLWKGSFTVHVSPLTSNADCAANRKGV